MTESDRQEALAVVRAIRCLPCSYRRSSSTTEFSAAEMRDLSERITELEEILERKST